MHLAGILLLFCAIVTIAYAKPKKEKKEEKAKWSYKDTAKEYSYSTQKNEEVLGPKDWGKAFEKCGKGKAQSPIDIVSKKAKKTKFGPLKLKFEDKNKDGFFRGSLVNDGHAPVFTMDKKEGNITIKFDKKEYILEKFLTHFGCKDKKGSEHTIDEKAFEGEMQFVFYNKKEKPEKAEKKKDGVLAISVFLEKSKDYYYYYNKKEGPDGLLTAPLTVISSGYVRVGMPVVTTELPLKKLIPSLVYKKKKDAPEYYTYKGSLTQPGCHENVRWVILKEPVEISWYLLNMFRSLKTKDGYDFFGFYKECDNFRPTQKLKKRKVEVFKQKKKEKKDKKEKKKNEDEESESQDEEIIESGSGNVDSDEEGSGHD
uniref:Alpha carbonic anhydrase 10 n=1 Tax=Exaiptasia diaphana TaxID=2652724 RepID=A0A1B0Y5I5_EXADI|nr:alpha carbonic anhydrase 10 [Exaiptasia diaphana]